MLSTAASEQAPGEIQSGNFTTPRSGWNLIVFAATLQGMNDVKNCYDNVFMESCFATLKTELELTESFYSLKAVRELLAYVSYYNPDRCHSSLGVKTPDDLGITRIVRPVAVTGSRLAEVNAQWTPLRVSSSLTLCGRTRRETCRVPALPDRRVCQDRCSGGYGSCPVCQTF